MKELIKPCICKTCIQSKEQALSDKEWEEKIEMIKAKIERNDNPILLAGLKYALTVLNKP